LGLDPEKLSKKNIRRNKEDEKERIEIESSEL